MDSACGAGNLPAIRQWIESKIHPMGTGLILFRSFLCAAVGLLGLVGFIPLPATTLANEVIFLWDPSAPAE